MIQPKQIHIDTLEPIAMLNSLMLKAAVTEGVLRFKSGNFDADAIAFASRLFVELQTLHPAFRTRPAVLSAMQIR